MTIELLFFAPILIGLFVAGSQHAIRFINSLDVYIKEMK